MDITIIKIQDRLSEHFTYLDRVVEGRLPDHDQSQRGPIVMELPLLDRDLYFVWDVISITCNAGIGAWIDYHIDDIGWIDDAARAFEAIGHGGVGGKLKECRDRYIAAVGDSETWDYSDLSAPIWHAEEQMEKDLYKHLLAGNFSFQRHSPNRTDTQ